MLVKKMALSFLILLCMLRVNSQQSPLSNPLLLHSNNPIPFGNINSRIVEDATASEIKFSKIRILKIIQVESNDRTFSNTLKGFDDINYELTDLSQKVQLIGSTYEDDSTRTKAQEGLEKLSLFQNNLYLNEGLYNALKQYAATEEAKTLAPNKQKYLRESILLFEKNGMRLSAAERKELESLNQKLVYFSTEFDKNIAESKDSIAYTEAQLKGVPDDIKAPWKRGDDQHVVYINIPNSLNIAKYASVGDTRHSMYVRSSQRAFPKNIAVLDSLFYYRNIFAQKLGFKSFAAYTVADKMASTPANVWAFEKDLVAKLAKATTKDIDEMRELKQQLKLEQDTSFYAWDVSFYKNKLLDTKYQLNTDEVKRYFEMNNTINGMFQVYEQLFSISIKEAKQPVWQRNVKSYEMYKNGKKTGSFYLDLYPRKNKYNHFACFPISFYYKGQHADILPVAALVCNFAEGTAEEPSLLNHSEVVILFHEFGHLVHMMLSRSDLASQSGFSLKQDFVEAPSQFLENWCWEYEALKMFARDYKTGEVLPESLFNKMKQTKMVGSALSNTFQLYAGILDFTYEDKYDSIKDIGITQVSHDLFSINQLPVDEENHFICSFPHLTGYGAQYYGYLWSKVFAQDMFTAFEKNGIMDTGTGSRYRNEILEKGASLEEMDMLRNFLGREPNSKAFLRSLGIQ